MDVFSFQVRRFGGNRADLDSSGSEEEVEASPPKRARGPPANPSSSSRQSPSHSSPNKRARCEPSPACAAASIEEEEESEDEVLDAAPVDLASSEDRESVNLINELKSLRGQLHREMSSTASPTKDLDDCDPLPPRRKRSRLRPVAASLETQTSGGPAAVELSTAPPQPRAEAAAARGPPVKLFLRPGGNANKQAFQIRLRDPLAKLLGAFCDKNRYAPDDVMLELDGDTVDGTKSASDYDLDGEEIIDVKIRTGAVQHPPTAAAAPPPPAVAPAPHPAETDSEKARATTREMETLYVTIKMSGAARKPKPRRLHIRADEPLEKAVVAYCRAVKFDDIAAKRARLFLPDGTLLTVADTPANQNVPNHAHLELRCGE